MVLLSEAHVPIFISSVLFTQKYIMKSYRDTESINYDILHSEKSYSGLGISVFCLFNLRLKKQDDIKVAL